MNLKPQWMPVHQNIYSALSQRLEKFILEWDGRSKSNLCVKLNVFSKDMVQYKSLTLWNHKIETRKNDHTDSDAAVEADVYDNDDFRATTNLNSVLASIVTQSKKSWPAHEVDGCIENLVTVYNKV